MHALAAPLFDRRARLRLSIRADLFGLFFGGSGSAWLVSRKLVGIEAAGALPALGQLRARSGSAAEARR